MDTSRSVSESQERGWDGAVATRSRAQVTEPGWAGGAGGRPEVPEGPTPMIVPRSEHWRKRNVRRFPSEFTSFPGYEQKDRGIRELRNIMEYNITQHNIV